MEFGLLGAGLVGKCVAALFLGRFSGWLSKARVKCVNIPMAGQFGRAALLACRAIGMRGSLVVGWHVRAGLRPVSMVVG